MRPSSSTNVTPTPVREFSCMRGSTRCESERDAISQGADRARGRESHDPGGSHVLGNAPANGPEALGSADAENAARNDVGRADGHSKMARDRNNGGAGTLRGEPMDRFQANDL